MASPESANNATSSAGFIPLLALGIPASAPLAVLLGGLLVYGLQPGPLPAASGAGPPALDLTMTLRKGFVPIFRSACRSVPWFQRMIAPGVTSIRSTVPSAFGRSTTSPSTTIEV